MKASSARTSPARAARPSSKTISLLLLCLLACLSAQLASGVSAQKDDEEEVVRVNSDLVVLNVTVTDAKGRYVHQLKRADFKIFEDGREQRIGLFSVEETPFAAAILLDSSGSMESRLTLARAAALRFLEGLREEDVAAVYNFDSKVEQLQDFVPGRDLPPLAYDLGSKGMTTLNDAVLRRNSISTESFSSLCAPMFSTAPPMTA